MVIESLEVNKKLREQKYSGIKREAICLTAAAWPKPSQRDHDPKQMFYFKNRKESRCYNGSVRVQTAHCKT